MVSSAAGLQRRTGESGHCRCPADVDTCEIVVAGNKPFGRWERVFGDATVAAAMIGRLVHHAEVVSLKGGGYRLKDRDLGRVPSDYNPQYRQAVKFRPLEGAQFPAGVDRDRRHPNVEEIRAVRQGLRTSLTSPRGCSLA